LEQIYYYIHEISQELSIFRKIIKNRNQIIIEKDKKIAELEKALQNKSRVENNKLKAYEAMLDM
jgi:hypothetical protein